MEKYAVLCIFSHKTLFVNINKQKPFKFQKKLLYLREQKELSL